MTRNENAAPRLALWGSGAHLTRQYCLTAAAPTQSGQEGGDDR
jgi:hypothetical protein